MGPIEKLKASRWWKPALRKYASYVQAHKRQGCIELKERFVLFAADVLQTPESKRDELLSIDKVERTPPGQRYRQYDSPIPKEMKIGTVVKRRR